MDTTRVTMQLSHKFTMWPLTCEKLYKPYPQAEIASAVFVCVGRGLIIHSAGSRDRMSLVNGLSRRSCSALRKLYYVDYSTQGSTGTEKCDESQEDYLTHLVIK